MKQPLTSVQTDSGVMAESGGWVGGGGLSTSTGTPETVSGVGRPAQPAITPVYAGRKATPIMSKHKTPTQIATLIVPRLLAGESLTRRSIQRDYKAKRAVVAEAIRIARGKLYRDHMAILPIAHNGEGYTVNTTLLPRVMYRGEIPELRANKTRAINQNERIKRYAPHAARSKTASKVSAVLDAQTTAYVMTLDLVESFAAEEASA